jgi:hypothetical protein
LFYRLLTCELFLDLFFCHYPVVGSVAFETIFLCQVIGGNLDHFITLERAVGGGSFFALVFLAAGFFSTAAFGAAGFLVTAALVVVLVVAIWAPYKKLTNGKELIKKHAAFGHICLSY